MPPKTAQRSNMSLAQKALSRPYVIVAIHISDPTLKWLKKDFGESLKKHKRKAVVGILYDDVVRQVEESRRLAQEAAEQATSVKGTSLKGSPSTKGSAFLDPAELIYQEIQKRILDLLSECVKDDILEAKSKINIIEVWDNLKTTDKASTTPKGGKVSKPFQSDTHQCLMRPTDQHALKGSRVDVNRQLFLKIQDLIIDNPENVGVITYLFLLGEFELKTYMKLMAENYPLKYICFFHAKDFTIDPDELNDIEMLKFSERTKNRGIIETNVVPLSWCLAQKYSQQIYKELSYYAYDLIMLENKHKYYLENFVEMNVDEAKPILRLTEPTMLNKNYPLFAPDELILPIYLNLLFNSVCGENSPKDNNDLIDPYGTQDNPLQNLTPKIITFTENQIDYLCVENSNLLLKLMICSRISTEDYEIVSKYWHMAEKCNRINIDHKLKCGKKSMAQNNFTEKYFTYYVELYSEQSFSQKLLELRNSCKQFITEFDDKTKLTYFTGFDQDLVFNNRNVFFPTKLCYRDFLLYLNPLDDEDELSKSEEEFLLDVENQQSTIKMHNEFIRMNSLKGRNMPPQSARSSKTNFLIKPLTFEDIPEPRTKTYFGYNLGDVQKQLDLTQIIYQSSQNCSILYRREDWVKDFITGQLNFTIFGHKIFCNKNTAKPRNIARIITKKYSAITINFQCISDKKVVADLAVSWPNGLFIKMKYNWDTEIIDDLQQSYIGTSHSEENRIFNLDGSLIKIFKTGEIILFCSNGNIYETNKKLDSKPVKGKNVGMEFQFIEKYSSILDELNFSIIKASGMISRAYDGQLHENCERKLLLTEYHDYANNEILAIREDGVKFLWNANQFKFYYPDGTLITTEVIDKDLFESTFEDNWKSKLKTRSSVSEAYIVIQSIIEELLDITQQENFVICSCKYTIEHENFATVEIGDQTSRVISPDTLLKFSGQEIQMKIEDNILLNFTKNNFITKLLDENENFTINVYPSLLNFPFMQLHENNKLIFTIDHDGKWIINQRKCSLTSFNENCSNILMMRNNNEGGEIVNKVVQNANKNWRDGKTMIILDSLDPFEKIYRMSSHREFLNKFNGGSYNCKLEPKAKLLTYRFMYMSEVDCRTGILKYPKVNITVSKLQDIIQNTIKRKEKSLCRKADKGDKCFYILHYCELKKEQTRVLDLILTNSFPKYFDVHKI